MDLDDAIEREAVEPGRRRQAAQPLEHGQVRAVEQEAAAALVGHAREVVEDVQLAHVERARRVLGQDAQAGRRFDARDRLGAGVGRVVVEDGRQQHLVAAIARAEVPQPGVAAQPGGADGARGGGGAAQPLVVGVARVLEVEVEKVVGRGAPFGGPAPHVLVEAAGQIAAVLEELHQARVIGDEGAGVDAVHRRARLGRNPHAQTR